MQSALTQVKKFEILSKRSKNVCKVKKYIDTYLDPSSKKFFNDKTIQEILFNIEIKKVDYYWVLLISPETD